MRYSPSKDTDPDARYFSGAEVYGDDLDEPSVLAWIEDEAASYFALATNGAGAAHEPEYEYGAFNHYHAFSVLADRRFETCLALGCGTGQDVAPLARQVDRFVAIEPVEEWWRDNIGGRPAAYIKPSTMGDIPLETGSADLATSLGVLHHIPTATRVINEIARVLRPGGVFVLREPISAMGDWRRPRPGLTPHERGFPIRWLDDRFRQAGFRVLRRRVCMFSLLNLLAPRLGVPRPYDSPPLVVADHLLAVATSWNVHYYRNSAFKKVGPQSAFFVLERT